MILALELFLQQKFSESLLEWQKLLECDASNSALHREIEDAKQKIWEMNVSKEIREEIFQKLGVLLKLYKVEYMGNLLQEDMSDNHKPHCPSAIAFDSDACLYAVEEFEHCIKKYSSDGKFITQFGSKGSAPGEFHYPTDIAIDKNNNLYITDRWNHRIQKFSCSGEFILIFDNPKGTIITEPNCITIAEQSSRLFDKNKVEQASCLLNKNNHDDCSTLNTVEQSSRLLNKDNNQDGYSTADNEGLIFVGYLGDSKIHCFSQDGNYKGILNLDFARLLIRFPESIIDLNSHIIFSHRNDSRLFVYDGEKQTVDTFYLSSISNYDISFADTKLPSIITSDDILSFGSKSMMSPDCVNQKICKFDNENLIIKTFNNNKLYYHIVNSRGYMFLRFIRSATMVENDFLFGTFIAKDRQVYIYVPSTKQINIYKVGNRQMEIGETKPSIDIFYTEPQPVDITIKLRFFRNLVSNQTLDTEKLELAKNLFDEFLTVYTEKLLDLDDEFMNIFGKRAIEKFPKLGIEYLNLYINSVKMEEIDEKYCVDVLCRLSKFKLGNPYYDPFSNILKNSIISQTLSLKTHIEHYQKKYYIKEVKRLKFDEFSFNWVIGGFEENTYLAIDEKTNSLIEFSFDGEIISTTKLPFEEKPLMIFSDKSEKLFIPNYHKGQLVQLDRNCQVLLKIDKIREHAAEFHFWTGVHCKSNILYACDYKNGKIYKFNDKGECIGIIGKQGKEIGQLDGPMFTFVDNNENVFVTEWENKRLQIFDKNGITLSILNFDSKYFNKPHNVILDNNGEIYIGGNIYNRFVKYNSQLELLYLFFLLKPCYVCDMDRLKRLICCSTNNTSEITFYSLCPQLTQ